MIIISIAGFIGLSIFIADQRLKAIGQTKLKVCFLENYSKFVIPIFELTDKQDMIQATFYAHSRQQQGYG